VLLCCCVVGRRRLSCGQAGAHFDGGHSRGPFGAQLIQFGPLFAPLWCLWAAGDEGLWRAEPEVGGENQLAIGGSLSSAICGAWRRDSLGRKIGCAWDSDCLQTGRRLCAGRTVRAIGRPCLCLWLAVCARRCLSAADCVRHTVRQKYGYKFLCSAAQKCNRIFDAPCTQSLRLVACCSSEGRPLGLEWAQVVARAKHLGGKIHGQMIRVSKSIIDPWDWPPSGASSRRTARARDGDS